MGQKSVDKGAQPAYTHRNQRVIIPDDYLAIGLIVGVHGIHGELKVELHTDFPERFTNGSTIYMTEKLKEITIQKARPHKGHILITLDGINSRNQAQELRQSWLFVSEDDAMELDADTYWVHDLIGMTVVELAPTDKSSDASELQNHQADRELGRITDVIVTGANDVYVIAPIGSLNRGRELLLPAIADVVDRVDLENKRMFVHLQPGLLEEDIDEEIEEEIDKES